MTRPKLILGGPGCGKTTALLQIVEDALADGASPESIAFVAFTRKAAMEARERMLKKFDLDKDSVPYFRTLHSFAFMHIPEDPSRLLNKKRLMEFARDSELDLRPATYDDFGMPVVELMNVDEQAMAAYSLSRITQESIRDVCSRFSVSPRYVEHVAKVYEDHKKKKKAIDFTDALVLFLEKFIIQGFKLLIVDEAQDLSPLQWRMVEVMMQHSEEVYIAGDDDQAIYEWAGADVEHFLNLDADREVLPISYRLKSNIFDACQKVIQYVDNRYPKNWQPHAEGGQIEQVNSLHRVDMSEGEWLLLARTNNLVQGLVRHVRSEGYPYLTMTENGVQSSVEVDRIKAVLRFERLRRGGRVTGEEADLIWTMVRSHYKQRPKPVFDPLQTYDLDTMTKLGVNADNDWMETMNLSESVRSYIRAMKARGESLTETPRITVSTIHGAKGGEADNVLLWTKLTANTAKSFGRGDPNEYRALFTAMSRAKDQLVLFTNSAENYGVERMIR
mgnify:CR=1 FL=1